jgi:hypothetical protein
MSFPIPPASAFFDRAPDLVWWGYPNSNYNTTELNVSNEKSIFLDSHFDKIYGEPNNINATIGKRVELTLHKEETDTSDTIPSPAIETDTFIFNYGDMQGSLSSIAGKQNPPSESEDKIVISHIVAGTLNFAFVVQGWIVRLPLDANNQYSYAAYFVALQ